MLKKEALKKMITGTVQERLYLAEQDFSLFFTYYYLDYIKYTFAPFHLEAMKKLQNLTTQEEVREFLWIGFRESAKTAVVRGFITWLALFKKSNYILIGSYTIENAEANLFAIIAELQTNPRIRADFEMDKILPEAKKDEKGFNRIKKFLLQTGVMFQAITTQKSPRGYLHKSQRPDFCFLDDIETLKTAMSDVVTQSTLRFIEELKTAMDSKTGKIVYNANHFSDLGVVQNLVNQRERMFYLNVPLYDPKGNISWPSKYVLTNKEAVEMGKVSIENIKRLVSDSVTFEQEYLNMPMAEDRRIFKKSMFQHIPFKDVPKDGHCYVILDPAFSKNATSDDTGISIVWVDYRNLWYVKAYKIKLSPKEFVDQIFALWELYKPKKIGIEKFAFTEGIKPYLDDEMRRRNTFLPIVELKHNQTNKNTRIQGLLPFYESQTIFHIENECDDLEAQLIRFPFAEHDDVMDSLAYAPQIANRPVELRDDYDMFPEDEMLYPDIGM